MKSIVKFHYEGQFIFQKLMKAKKIKELNDLIVFGDKVDKKKENSRIMKKFAAIFFNIKKSNF